MKINVKSFGALRFFMISTIFLAHISFIMTTESATSFFWNYLNNGIFGITFFLMLSGFCCHLGYCNKLEELNKDNYLAFVKKRICKIYPVYIIMQTLFLIMEIVKNPAVDAVKQAILKYVISIPLLQILIPSASVWKSLNAVSWFLSCLFIIYLAAPLIIMLANSIRKSFKKNMIILASLVFLFICFVFYSRSFLEESVIRDFVERSPIMCMLVFSIGVFLANIRIQNTILIDTKKKKIIFSIIEIIVLGVAILFYVFTVRLTPNWINYYFLKLLFFSVLISVFSYDGGICSKIFSLKIFQILGKSSFEFYLMHYFIIKLLAVPLQELIGTSNKANLIITINLFVLTWIVATVSNFICNRKSFYLNNKRDV